MVFHLVDGGCQIGSALALKNEVVLATRNRLDILCITWLGSLNEREEQFARLLDSLESQNGEHFDGQYLLIPWVFL